jgi:pilus assembly protein CpaC
MATFSPQTQSSKFFQGRRVLLGSLLLLAGLLLLAPAAFAQAQAQEASVNVSFLNPPKDPLPVYVLAGQSTLVVFDQPIGRLAVSNTDIAEAVLVAPNQMLVNGKQTGRARFTVWSKDTTQFIFFDVDVRPNLAQIDSQIRALFPKEDVRLSQANGAVVISGNLTPSVAKQVDEVVKAAGYKTVTLGMPAVENVLQVQLQVRVAEVSRAKLNELAVSPVYQRELGQGGYANTGQGPWTLGSVDAGSMFGSVASNLNIFGMAHNAFVFVRALAQQGALRALAEPNLVAMNGQQASFLAGGEIPVPVVSGASGTVSVTWKEYGVRVNFKPTILDEQHIRLEVEPEVSTLDYTNAVRLSGFLIPGLRVRRAKTGIELQDGQTFGIAGLLDNNETKQLGKIPVLGDVPIIGNLFKSKSFQKNETELVFFVTTKLTKALNPDAVPPLKGIDNIKNGSPLGLEAPEAPETGPVGGSSNPNGLAPAPDSPAPAGAPTEKAADPAEQSAPANPASSGETNGGQPGGTGTQPGSAAPAQTGDPPKGEGAPEKEPEKGKEPAKEKEPEKEKEKEKSAAPGSTPSGQIAQPAAERPPAPVRPIEAMTWKLKVPPTATVTAQRRP